MGWSIAWTWRTRRLSASGTGEKEMSPAFEELVIDLVSGKYPDWHSFANDMAEDDTIRERVLANYRKGAR